MAASVSLLGCYSASLSAAGHGPPFMPPKPLAATASIASRVLTPLCATSKTASAPAKGKGKPRGISQPKPISPAMQELLGVPEIPRTQALKRIWAYIKQHNLQVCTPGKFVV